MAINKMSVQEFGNTLNNVTQQMQSSQQKKTGLDINALMNSVQDCNEFILENKSVTLPDNVNKNVEKFIAAANLFIMQVKGDKSTQEKMGTLIAALSPITDDVEKLRNNLLRRRLVKKQRYGSKVEEVEKAREFKKK